MNIENREKKSVQGYFDDISDPEDWNFFYYSKYFDVETISNLKVKVFIDDDIGNSAVMEYTVPSPLDVVPVVKKETNVAKYSFYSKTGTQISQGLKLFDNKVQYFYLSYISQSRTYQTFDIYYNESYNFSFLVGNFLTEISQTAFTASVDVSTISSLVLGEPKYTLSKADDDGYIDINLNIQNKAAYDVILVKVRTQDSPANQGFTWAGGVSSKTCSAEEDIVATVRTDYLYGNSVVITLQGIKDLGITNEIPFSIPKINGELQYDNILPATKVDFKYDKMIITGKDIQSGIKQITATVIETGKKYTSTTDTLEVPVWDNRLYHLKYECEDKAGNVSSDTRFFSPSITIDFISVEKSSSAYTLVSKEYTEGFLYTNAVTSEVYNLQSNGSWNLYKTIPSTTYIHLVDTPEGNRKGKRHLSTTGSSPDVPLNSYIRVYSKVSGYYGVPCYFYTGEESSGKYDYILPKTKERVLVASDAPAFAHTIITSAPYDECKNWDVSEWENKHQTLGTAYMEFSESNSSPQSYNILVDQIPRGYCYCVIAHFANGSTDMSEVMVKE